jgi:hypothetical protein
VATVLGHEIKRSDCLARSMGIGSVEIGARSLVLGLLLEDFATSQQIDLTPEEIDQFWATARAAAARANPDPSKPLPEATFDEAQLQSKLKEVQDKLAAPDVPLLEQYALRSRERMWARGLQLKSVAAVTAYEHLLPLRRDEALYKKYGGKVVAGQISISPAEAYLKMAREAEADGRLKFHDDALAASFWKGLESSLSGQEVPPERVDFSLPVWLQFSAQLPPRDKPVETSSGNSSAESPSGELAAPAQ